MSTVRKASVLHPKAPVVIDLSYVSIADFSTAYVATFTHCVLKLIILKIFFFHIKGFDNLAEELYKRGHSIIITRAHPRVLNILKGVRGTKLHIHKDESDLDVLLQGWIITN